MIPVQNCHAIFQNRRITEGVPCYAVALFTRNEKEIKTWVVICGFAIKVPLFF